MVLVHASQYYYAMIDKAGRYGVVYQFKEKGKDMKHRPCIGYKFKGFAKNPVAYFIDFSFFLPSLVSIELISDNSNSKTYHLKHCTPPLTLATQRPTRSSTIVLHQLKRKFQAKPYGQLKITAYNQHRKWLFEQAAIASAESFLEHATKKPRKTIQLLRDLQIAASESPHLPPRRNVLWVVTTPTMTRMMSIFVTLSNDVPEFQNMPNTLLSSSPSLRSEQKLGLRVGYEKSQAKTIMK
ncbi:MAG: hypothetical protein Q9180_006865 [Flavoplaca navasiana]